MSRKAVDSTAAPSAAKARSDGKSDGKSRSRRLGKDLRRKVPRSAQSDWSPRSNGRDPIAILTQSDSARIAGLVPLRYARMAASPFAFLRGSAAVMAFDLSRTPTTGVNVQACGDSHLLNFSVFASPERRVIFDINDFDETLPAPWEWDIKRLAASFFVAGRYRGYAERHCREAVGVVARAYREKMADYAHWPKFQVWYARVDAGGVVELVAGARSSAKHSFVQSAATSTARLLPKLTEVVRGKRRIRDELPDVYHVADEVAFTDNIRTAIHRWRETLPADRRMLANQYEVVDAAIKVVGVGSVGTFCAVALLQADEDDSLFLQIKQARASVLEPYAASSKFSNQGERVVIGQRTMQSASDVFLGWSRIGKPAIDVYFRQLRDVKVSVNLDTLSLSGFIEYGAYCGWALARAHAKSGEAATISGYVGSGDVFDHALTRFAHAYADQTERDHRALTAAIKSGRIAARG